MGCRSASQGRERQTPRPNGMSPPGQPIARAPAHTPGRGQAASRPTPAAGRILVVLSALLLGCGQPAQPPAPPPGASPSGTNHSAVARTPTAPIPADPADLFEDVTAQAGLRFTHQLCGSHVANILQSNGAGGAVLDFDRDGWMDLYLVNSGPLDGVTQHPAGTTKEPNRLFRNRRNGTFEDVTEKSGLAAPGYGVTAAVGDYDNDGYPDVYVVNVGTNRLYRNRRDGTFEDVTTRTGVGDPGTGIAAVWADFDNDGHLDLFVANYLTFDPNYRLYFQPDGFPNALAYKPETNRLYRNRGDGTFEDATAVSGVAVPGHRAMCATAFDADLDGDADLYISNDLSPNLLLLNDGTGRFEEVGAKRGVAFNALGEAAGSMGATVGDADGDGLPDILVTRFGYGSLYAPTPQGVYSDRMVASGLGAITAQFVAWGGVFLDFDNDRDQDLFIANGDAHYLVGWQSLLLENRGDGTFTDAADRGGAVFHAKLRGRGAATLDLDNDGRMDLLMTAMADRPFLLRNRCSTPDHWLTLRLEGTRGNRDGFGAVIRVEAGGKTTTHLARASTTFLMQSDPRVHIGLGTATRAEQVLIRWPSGTTQRLAHLEADQILVVREPEQAP